MSNFITSDFEPGSAALWKQKIQFELDGADYNQTLLTQTNEGITIRPFYHADDFEKINIPVSKKNIKICQQLLITSEVETNLEAQKAIKKGINALKFEAQKPFNIELLFNNLLNKNIEFHFYFRFLSEAFMQQLLEILKNESVFLNIDIVGNLAKTGNWYTSLNADFKSIEKLIQKNNSAYILSVNAGLYQNAGANSVQQVAYALSHANEYFNFFGVKIVENMQFNFATGNQFFFEIAKIRAFRYLLNLILTEYNTKVEAQIFTEPSSRNKTIYSNQLNLLRTSNENMSSFLSGANAVAHYSFDFLDNTEKNVIIHKSMNQLLNLKENDYFKNPSEIVNDTYYVETLTKQIVEKALHIFKEIEKGGGFLTQLKEGTIQRKIAENAKKEQAEFDAGSRILVGSNKYVNPNEKCTLKVKTFALRKSHKTLIIPIIPKRLAEKLEQKRMKNEA